MFWRQSLLPLFLLERAEVASDWRKIPDTLGCVLNTRVRSKHKMSPNLAMKISRHVGVLLWLGVLNAASSIEFPPCLCVTWQSSNCVGDDRALTSTEVRLTYNCSGSDAIRTTTLTKINVSSMQYNLTYDCVDNGQTRKADYYFEQLEHGGGGCNCVDIDFNCDEQNRYEIFI